MRFFTCLNSYSHKNVQDYLAFQNIQNLFNLFSQKKKIWADTGPPPPFGRNVPWIYSGHYQLLTKLLTINLKQGIMEEKEKNLKREY